ncbi:MAG TPA: methionine ABC transporter permease [Clostridiales bacterium UBA8960]|jgi:D-methionine transport system permease protein|nr:methionine ABC transporter permease [Clostridiales bacterium UBA8960]
MIHLLLRATLETFYMVLVSTFFTVLFGLPLGIVLVVTSKGHIHAHKGLNAILSYVVNMARSLPFIILMIFIIPFTRMVVGTSIGTTAAIVPLVVAAIPFFARIVESALHEVDGGVVEAAIAMGASPIEIITRVLIPEALPSLILGTTITIINLLGYSAMAGAVGGGGIGDLAIRYGYHRFNTEIMFATIILLVVLVQGLQTTGNLIANRVQKHRRR